MTGEPVVVGDRYELGDPLGQGGMATVHRALDRRLDRAVAVKQLSVHLAADQTAQARFRREAQAAASLNHPSIAAVFDTGEGADSARGVALPYIVMELVEGSTLRTLLDAGRLQPERALRIVRDVLDALEHSHAMGLVHRDIKPANVMLTTGGAVKVMDFGIARAIDESATSLTKTASVIGTAQYLSPEQAMGQKVDLRSDLYSVGCLLFELVTGRPPFVGDTSVAIAYQHVRENPVPPSQLEPSLDPGFDALVLHALAKDPDDRYQTAAEMRDDVDRLLAGEAVAPPPVPADASALGDTVTVAAPLLAAPVAAAAVSGADGPPTAPTALLAAGRPAPLPEDEAPAERRRPGATRAVLVALGVFLVLALGAFGLFRVFGPAAGGSQAATVTVPDLDGLTQARAEAALRDADLVPRVTIESGKDDKTVGTVMDQTPAAEARVAGGSTVTLAVNGGPDNAEIPEDLVGRPIEDVEQELDELGFNDVSTVAVPGDGDVEPGEVISVEPGEGERVALDAAIEVRFARDSEAPATGGEDEAPAPSAPASPSETDDPGGDSDGDDEQTSRPREDPSSEAPDDEPDDEPTTTAPTTSAPTEDAEPTAPAPATSQATTEAPKKPKPTKTKKDPPGQGEGQGQGQGQGQQQGGD